VRGSTSRGSEEEERGISKAKKGVSALEFRGLNKLQRAVTNKDETGTPSSIAKKSENVITKNGARESNYTNVMPSM